MSTGNKSSAGGGRWSAKRKTSVVLELLRGADLEATSRKHRVTIATLTQWRERFLAGGEAGMKSRDPQDYTEVVSAIKQIGLKLEKYRGPVEFLVIDHISKRPTEN